MPIFKLKKTKPFYRKRKPALGLELLDLTPPPSPRKPLDHVGRFLMRILTTSTLEEAKKMVRVELDRRTKIIPVAIVAPTVPGQLRNL